MSNGKTMRVSFVKVAALAALAASLLLSTGAAKVAYAAENGAGAQDASAAYAYLSQEKVLSEGSCEKIDAAAKKNNDVVTTEMVVKGLANELTDLYNEKNTNGDTYTLPDSWTL